MAIVNRRALRVFFVRHGETAWSSTRQHSGRTDLPLTVAGEAQARALAPTFRHIAFSAVMTSPRCRARETCVRAWFCEHAQVDGDLAEWDHGAYEGLRTHEIHEAHPHRDIWRDGCPQGDSPADVSARADRVIARLRPLSGAVALFSHGQFGRVPAVRWVGLQVGDGRCLSLDPASISRPRIAVLRPGLVATGIRVAAALPANDQRGCRLAVPQ